MNREKFFNQPIENNAFSKINITNLVDIALTLVVILLMVSPFIEQGFQVKLPTSNPSKMTVEKSLILTIAENDKILIGNNTVSLSELKNVLEQKTGINPEAGVIIEGNRNISYQSLITVLDIIKSSNITKVGLATEIEQNK